MRLKDVAEVVDGVENDQVSAWANGKPAVFSVDPGFNFAPGKGLAEALKRKELAQ